MTFSYSSVSVGDNTYDTYVDQDEADTYIGASMSGAADTWRDSATSEDIKGRAIVSATRWLDSVAWAGDKADSTQVLAWPRKNIDGVDDTALPSQLTAACIELAMALVDDNDARSDLTSPGIKAQRAGSVSIDYFRPEGDTQVQTPFPAVVMALISQWLGGAAQASLGALPYGEEYRSRLLRGDYGFDHGL